jgi:hypothetical protein
MITGVINNVLEDYGSAEESIEPLVHILGEFLTSKRLEYLAKTLAGYRVEKAGGMIFK